MRFLLFLLGALLLSSPALGRGRSRERRAARRLRRLKRQQFRAHQKLGKSLYKQKRYKDALESFLKAISIKKEKGLYFNIAQCYRFIGKPKKALEYYALFHVALDSIRRLSRRQRRLYKREVEGLMVKMRAEVARLEKAAQKRARLEREAQLKRARERARLLKLERQRELLKRRARLERERIKKQKEALALKRRLEAQRKELARLRAARARAAAVTNKWWFWTGIGVTALFSLSTAYFGVKALDAAEEWEREWDPATRDEVKRSRNLADLSLGGALLTGVGTALYVMYHKIKHGNLPGDSPKVSLIPGCNTSGCVLQLSVGF